MTLYGLVLAGGKSLRMQQDKGKINYHGQEHRLFLYHLLEKYCEQVFISCRADQVHEFDKAYHTLIDAYENIGPIAGILSAFEYDKNAHWLVVACDLPFFDEATLRYLIEQQRSDEIATVFYNTQTNFLEPLAAIWHPSSYPVLQHALKNQQYALHRLLKKEVKIPLTLPSRVALININYPSDYQLFIKDKSLKKAIKKKAIIKVEQEQTTKKQDFIAVEEPLEIRIGFGKGEERQQRSLAVTMRTPGHDFELALGFLFTEGIIKGKAAVEFIRFLPNEKASEHPENIVKVEVQPSVIIDFNRLERHFFTASSCGICGKSSIEAVRVQHLPFLIPAAPKIPISFLYTLPQKLRQQQAVFEHTGGLHAAALFDSKGTLLFFREDVGRHNALDKLIGAALEKDLLPLKNHVILVSGRLSFELVQKALAANISILVGIGAASSLAVELAEEFDMTLIGFLRNQTFNIYCGKQRIL